MEKTTTLKMNNEKLAKALKLARLRKELTRNELAFRLNLSPKTIEKYENGRAVITKDKINLILQALEISQEEFKKIKEGKLSTTPRKKKTVLTNKDRRSYQRIITKEVRVLKCLRKVKNISQDEASALCQYSRPTIGHIENGRIELSESRVRHILKSYGVSWEKFQEYMKEEILRDQIIDECYLQIQKLPEEKLKLVSNLINNL